MAARAAAFDKVQHALLPELDSILNINNHDLQKVGIKNNSAYARVCLSGESEAAEMAYRHFDKNKNNILDNEEVQKFIDTQKKNGKVKEITISNTDHDFVEVVFSNGTKQHMPVRLGDTVKTAHIMF